MSDEARRAAVVALVGLAGSPDCRDRADAGGALARFAELAEAGETLLRLVLDPEDTFVTRVTAEALLRRGDVVGLAVVASALAAADVGHVDWIHAAVLDVFGVFAGDRDAAVRECGVLGRDADERTRRGARELAAALAAINPVLHPARDD
ncbi:hypothetical protein Q5530_06285 [Saccharothrix sp. BKS2]|uniref:hypothetical protein n=1 Tax=Saccharothrix sp. BKS2 TaxID=3064400 RepID=UPI0039EBC7D1